MGYMAAEHSKRLENMSLCYPAAPLSQSCLVGPSYGLIVKVYIKV